MYYIFDSDFPTTSDGTYFDIDDGVELDGIDNWARGVRFEVTPPNPIEIRITRIGEDHTSLLYPIPFNDQNICIASPQIVDILKRCSVDTIEIYPAVLRDTDTGAEHTFFAINITSLIKAADLFKSSQIKPDKIFRLFESRGQIIVTEEIKQALEEIPNLTFRKITGAQIPGGSFANG